MSIFKAITDFFVEALTPNIVKKKLAQRQPLDANQRWALATGAQLTALNKDSNDTLNPDPTKDSSTWQHALITWWDVSTRAELQERLKHLHDTGHRTDLRPTLGHDVLAWDLVRMVNVARWGYGARYLSEEEAWAYILDAAAQLRDRYDSWYELAADYVAGHDAWAGEADLNLLRETKNLLNAYNPKSPWIQMEWAAFRNMQ